jgi:ATP-dependent Clp protease ATP-binding subunit ClpC
MATLHVRNVPDPLYAWLRQLADENGRSIGAQTIALLNDALAPHRRPAAFLGRRRRPSGSLQSFSAAARAVVVDAEAVARAHGCDHVGTDHLLLGVVASGAGVPPQVTAAAVEAALRRGEGAPAGTIPFAPETEQALELAMRESLRTGMGAIEPHHLAVGICSAGGPGSEILARLGVDESMLRSATPSPTADEFRVVELAGAPEEWEAQLNALATQCELVQIVERRAIFRRR